MLSTRYKIFALIDCNNFYASCERLFHPKLNNKPVLVLSSNNGCVIARSNEAKALGIQMSQPFFQIEKLCQQHNVQVFSSNFALYGDISNRVMKTINALCPDMEMYSIDEAFVRLDTMAQNSMDYAIKIRATILKNIGMPVSIGLAPTKTLAKVATHIAKQYPHIGVYDLRSETVRNIILKDFPVRNVWGIGKQTAQKLEQLKIDTVSKLCSQPTAFLQKRFGIVMTRIVMELQGISCVSLDDAHHKKNITCSRSFGKPVTQLSDLQEAISSYAARACEKARSQHSKAQGICVYLRTSPFNKTKPYYSASDQQTLLLPSNDTVLITRIATDLMKKIFKPHYHYQKVGILLLDLVSEKTQQHDFFEHDTNSDNTVLMRLFDTVNKKWGAQTLFLAAEGIQKNWHVKQIKRSLRYTTRWHELRVI